MYTLIRRKGLKNLSLRVTQKGIRMYVPKYTPNSVIQAFWNKHKADLQKVIITQGNDDYLEKKEEARKILIPLIEEWALRMELSYNQVRIKNTTSRWGSCSSKKNLNFSYKVAFLPTELRDYIIIHELSHLKYLDHSPLFWSFIEQYHPQYRESRKALAQLTLSSAGKPNI